MGNVVDVPSQYTMVLCHWQVIEGPSFWHPVLPLVEYAIRQHWLAFCPAVSVRVLTVPGFGGEGHEKVCVPHVLHAELHG